MSGQPGNAPGAQLGKGRGAGTEGRGPRGGKETCQGVAGGGVGSDRGAGCTLEPGAGPRGPSFWSQAAVTGKRVGGGGFENWVFAAEGRERGVSCSDADFGALGEWAGVLRGPFSLKDGRRVGGHRGLSISGASREVAPGRPETA